MTRKKDVEKEYGLPTGSLECLARTFLPGIQAFFEIEENQRLSRLGLHDARRSQKKKRLPRVYLRSQKCWNIRQKAPDARRMSAALLCGMQANATQQMELFGRIEQRWGIFRYTLRKYKGRASYRALRLLTVVCHR